MMILSRVGVGLRVKEGVVHHACSCNWKFFWEIEANCVNGKGNGLATIIVVKINWNCGKEIEIEVSPQYLLDS